MPQKHKIRHAGSQKPHLCGGKRRYTSKEEALLVKEEQEVITSGLELSIYRCIQCGGYHLTRAKNTI